MVYGNHIHFVRVISLILTLNMSCFNDFSLLFSFQMEFNVYGYVWDDMFDG